MAQTIKKDEVLKPTAILNNLYSVFPSFARLAGIQLDVFTPLKGGALTAERLSNTPGVREDKLYLWKCFGKLPLRAYCPGF